MNIRFDNDHIFVSGGTRGIGKQMAQNFESLGGIVYLTGRSEIPPDFVKRGNFHYLQVDFSNSLSTDVFLKKISNLNQISICINNAGINKINLIENVLDEDFNEMMKVNLEMPFKITQIFSKNMKKNNYGRIVNISSIFGHLSREKRSVYSMTKSGINGLTVSTSVELAKYGILVNTVSPEFTLTDLTRKNLSPEEMAELNRQIPIGRMAEVSEISNIVLFLSSKLNSYLTGQNIFVDGGFTNV